MISLKDRSKSDYQLWDIPYHETRRPFVLQGRILKEVPVKEDGKPLYMHHVRWFTPNQFKRAQKIQWRLKKREEELERSREMTKSGDLEMKKLGYLVLNKQKEELRLAYLKFNYKIIGRTKNQKIILSDKFNKTNKPLKTNNNGTSTRCNKGTRSTSGDGASSGNL